MPHELVFFHTPRYKLVLSFVIGLFLYIFLLAFLPFGVDNYNPNHSYSLEFLFELGYFIPITSLISLFNEFGIKSLFKKHLSYGFIIGWTLWSFVLLGLVIFITYNYLGDWHDWKLSSAIGFVADVSKILVFPMAGTFVYFRYRALQEKFDGFLTNIERSIDDRQMIRFTGQGTKDKISVTVADFLYARTQDNYVELYFLKNGQLSRFLIRCSMTAMYDSLEYDFLVRCHRSYMVNLYNVASIKGNRNDLRITMSHAEETIPVSRTYVDGTLEGLKKYKHFQ
ncbi:MAG TPA: LytTR family DNA-binding domain-containing protein [Eudoraea sp.]|nr:LytTR family DNA-binding domain-containing protein [Eudoraea sp.]